MRKDEKTFFIGWQDSMPIEHKSTVRKFIVLVFMSFPILVFVLIYSQKGFNNHSFELGKLTALTGVYHSSPVPILEIEQNEQSAHLSKYALLVGYGKFGAEGIIKTIEKESGNLNGRRVTIQGTLIYGDGKSVLELSEKEKSLIKVHNEISSKIPIVERLATISIEGEILDPKCYFGVMKPGEGKIHKSCAVRCISGGIPPVFRTENAQNKNEYFILLGENGEKINKNILDKVAENVSLRGNAGKKNGWDYLYVNPQSIELIEK